MADKSGWYVEYDGFLINFDPHGAVKYVKEWIENNPDIKSSLVMVDGEPFTNYDNGFIFNNQDAAIKLADWLDEEGYHWEIKDVWLSDFGITA